MKVLSGREGIAYVGAILLLVGLFLVGEVLVPALVSGRAWPFVEGTCAPGGECQQLSFAQAVYVAINSERYWTLAAAAVCAIAAWSTARGSPLMDRPWVRPSLVATAMAGWGLSVAARVVGGLRTVQQLPTGSQSVPAASAASMDAIALLGVSMLALGAASLLASTFQAGLRQRSP